MFPELRILSINLYYIGFHVYVVCAAANTLLIAYRIYFAIVVSSMTIRMASISRDHEEGRRDRDRDRECDRVPDATPRINMSPSNEPFKSKSDRHHDASVAGQSGTGQSRTRLNTQSTRTGKEPSSSTKSGKVLPSRLDSTETLQKLASAKRMVTASVIVAFTLMVLALATIAVVSFSLTQHGPIHSMHTFVLQVTLTSIFAVSVIMNHWYHSGDSKVWHLIKSCTMSIVAICNPSHCICARRTLSSSSSRSDRGRSNGSSTRSSVRGNEIMTESNPSNTGSGGKSKSRSSRPQVNDTANIHTLTMPQLTNGTGSKSNGTNGSNRSNRSNQSNASNASSHASNASTLLQGSSASPSPQMKCSEPNNVDVPDDNVLNVGTETKPEMTINIVPPQNASPDQSEIDGVTVSPHSAPNRMLNVSSPSPDNALSPMSPHNALSPASPTATLSVPGIPVTPKITRYSLRSSMAYNSSNVPSQFKEVHSLSALRDFDSSTTGPHHHHSNAREPALLPAPTFTLMSHSDNGIGDGVTVLVPLETSLNKINSNGRFIGNRGMASPQRIRESQKEKWQKMNAAATAMDKKSDGFVYTEEYLNHRETNLAPIKEELKAAKRTTKRITAFEREHNHISGPSHLEPVDLNPAELDDEEFDSEHRITTVVFDLEYVLTTNINKLKFKGVDGVIAMDPIRKKLCFGGDHRIEALQQFLERIHARNDEIESARESIKCFILCNESSKMVLQLLMDCNLVRYFISRFGNQLVSHVIGWDHGMAQETNHKKHLILLKLMDSLGRAHDEMLFVGNHKEDMDHIRSIDLCRTYWCQTQGLTQEAMNTMTASFF